MNNFLSSRTALVLAGAGAAGNAWQIGLIAGMADAGLDITASALIIGTSAGSTVAAQVTSDRSPAQLYASILAEVVSTAPPRGRTIVSGPDYMQWSDAIIAVSTGPADMRRRYGAAALALDSSDGADQGRWHHIVASRLPSRDWPLQRILVTAIDAETGSPVVFDRDSGVDLVDAVAASTSAMTPYRIGEHRYLNGGYRRSSNADLATGFERVLILEPFSGRSRHPVEWGMDLATQVDELRGSGSEVEVVFPDEGAGDVFNANALDPATRLPAARGGYAQGQLLAERLAVTWV